MNCTSRGDPSPSLWLKLADERILISPPSEAMSDRLTVTPQLLVRSGFVICRATNSEGSSQTMTWVGPFDSGRYILVLSSSVFALDYDPCHLNIKDFQCSILIL